jgi:hypothetical protein
MTIAVSDMQTIMPIDHRIYLCILLGASNRTRRAMTASFGKPSVSIPGTYAAIIHLIVFCFCSKERSAKCRPLPQETDIVTRMFDRTAQTYLDDRNQPWGSRMLIDAHRSTHTEEKIRM